jgi:hypothetical protein
MGGTYDRETGQIVWTMHVPLAEQLAHYRAHPPRAIRELVATPVDIDFGFDGHGEPVNAIFALACRCGGTRFTATCGIYDGEACAPISIECDACENLFEIFDAAAHGYDAELNADEVEQPEDTNDLMSDAVAWPHEVVVRYEFPSEHLGTEEWRGREHDLFSWFTLLARDPATKQLAFLYDAECA